MEEWNWISKVELGFKEVTLTSHNSYNTTQCACSSQLPTHIHTRVNPRMYRMTLSSCNLVTAVLLLLSVTWQCDSENCRRYKLRELFKEALVNSMQ